MRELIKLYEELLLETQRATCQFYFKQSEGVWIGQFVNIYGVKVEARDFQACMLKAIEYIRENRKPKQYLPRYSL